MAKSSLGQWLRAINSHMLLRRLVLSTGLSRAPAFRFDSPTLANRMHHGNGMEREVAELLQSEEAECFATCQSQTDKHTHATRKPAPNDLCREGRYPQSRIWAGGSHWAGTAPLARVTRSHMLADSARSERTQGHKESCALSSQVLTLLLSHCRSSPSFRHNLAGGTPARAGHIYGRERVCQGRAGAH